MSTIQAKDRASLCTFTFADGRRCRTPLRSGHPQFCYFHARKQAQAEAAEGLGRDFTFLLSGDYFSACDLAAALGRLFAAVARGDVKPRAAATLAYLAQTLQLTIQAAQHEYINAFGSDAWRNTVYSHIKQNQNYLAQLAAQTAPQPTPQPCSAGFTPASSSSPSAPQATPQLTDPTPQPASVATQPPDSVEAGLQPGSPSVSTKVARPPRKPRLSSSAKAPQPASVTAQPPIPVEAQLPPGSASAPTLSTALPPTVAAPEKVQM